VIPEAPSHDGLADSAVLDDKFRINISSFELRKQFLGRKSSSSSEESGSREKLASVEHKKR
jgi:hypothetical protein